MITGLQAQDLSRFSAKRMDSLSLDSMSAGARPETASTRQFGDLFEDALKQSQRLEADARTAIEGLMAGSGVDIHQAMIAAEKASMAFDLVLSVRNKAVQSYQSVMNMQF